MNKIILIPLFFIVLTSCIIHRPYPTEWSPLKSTKDDICLDISGTYNEVGKSWDGRETVQFSEFLFKEMYHGKPHVEPIRNVEPVETVKISQLDNGFIQISLWKGDILIHTHGFSQREKDFTCSSKGINFSGYFESESLYLGILYNWGDIHLHKSTDGSLVLKKVSGGIITLLVFPFIFVNEHSWYRFEPVNARKS